MTEASNETTPRNSSIVSDMPIHEALAAHAEYVEARGFDMRSVTAAYMREGAAELCRLYALITELQSYRSEGPSTERGETIEECARVADEYRAEANAMYDKTSDFEGRVAHKIRAGAALRIAAAIRALNPSGSGER